MSYSLWLYSLSHTHTHTHTVHIYSAAQNHLSWFFTFPDVQTRDSHEIRPIELIGPPSSSPPGVVYCPASSDAARLTHHLGRIYTPSCGFDHLLLRPWCIRLHCAQEPPDKEPLQGKNLTGVMPIKGHFARQKHTPNKNVRQVTYKVYIFPFHVKGP